MASPPGSPPPPLPPSDASASPSTVKWARKAIHLRSLSTRPPGGQRPVVHIDPATSKANDPHKKKLRTYLGVMARDKVDVTWNLKSQRLLTVGRKRNYFRLSTRDGGSLNQTSRGNGPLQSIRTVWMSLSMRNTAKARKNGPRCAEKEKGHPETEHCPHVLSRGGYEYLEQKLPVEKTKKKLEEAAQSGSVDGVIDPPSPVRRHVKWKMARTKKTGEMTTKAVKEITKKIDSSEEQASQGSFVPHGRQDVLTAAIGRPEHLGCVRAARAGVTIKQYFGSAPRTSRISSSLPPEELQQLTQQIRDQLEESITEKSQMQSQGLALPPEPLVGLSGPRVRTKEICVDPSGNDPETGDSDRCGLYIEANLARLVALGRVYEGSTVVHNTSLLSGQVKMGVEEVKDPDAPVHVPTDEAIHTFPAWPTHLVKPLSQQAVVSPAKPPEKPDLKVTWDATMFGVFNPGFPLYIKHEDLSEIAHSGQCLNISVLQLWILHLTETSMRAGNSDLYGFLEPQSIQRFGQSQFEAKRYIKSWMQSSKRDVYLGAYLNGPDNYLKGIINSALKGLDDAPQPKSKAPARWIIVKYFNNPRPLEPERLKALRIQ
ncbi:hypothetical protein HKD37_17G048731 [Glycine soja]